MGAPCPMCRGALLDPPVRNLLALQIARDLHGLDACPRCDLLMLRESVASHELACTATRAACEHCGGAAHWGAASCECGSSFPCQGLLFAHRRVCEEQEVPCPCSGCDARPRRRHLEAHVMLCGHHLVRCPHPSCNSLFAMRLIHAHAAACEFGTTWCPNAGCPENPVRRDLQAHLSICGYRSLSNIHANAYFRLAERR